MMAAEAVFSRSRTPKAQARDRALLTAAAGLERFTTHEVAQKAAGSTTGAEAGPWYGAASFLLRTLAREGHIEIVSAPGAKPYVYAWADEDAAAEDRSERGQTPGAGTSGAPTQVAA